MNEGIMEKEPLVSIVMSVYNGDKYLCEAVESILSQTYKNIQFVIVNDGSTDRTGSILKKYAASDTRVTLIEQENIGLSRSLNKAVRLSRGSLIARQDADDISMPNRLAMQSSAFYVNPGIDLVASGYYIIDADGDVILKRLLPSADKVKKLLPFENLIYHSSVMFKKQSFMSVGGYNENLEFGHDKDLWKRLDRLEVIPSALIKFRWHYSNVTHNRFKKGDKSSEFLVDRKVRFISSLLLQENDRLRARSLLRPHIRIPRHFFYFLLTYLPRWMIELFMWKLRYLIKNILCSLCPYYGTFKQ
jgi:glycosyltransferase involved in cell wall biosynthesis